MSFKKFLKESEVFYKSFNDALNGARTFAKNKGFEIDEEDLKNQTKFDIDDLKKGEYKTYSVGLLQNGAKVNKTLNIRVYNSNTDPVDFQLNVYTV